MKLFFDTEFTELVQNTTLISLGVIGEDGSKFYAEFTDYDKELAKDNFIKNTILKNLILGDMKENTYKPIKDNWKNQYVKGDKQYIHDQFHSWIEYNYPRYQTDILQFVSDVSHYDFVLLVDLLTMGKSALELPKYVSSYCHDINQDIANYYKISDYEAFNKNREQIVELDLSSEKVNQRKHNSLWDALVIAKIYNKLEYYNRNKDLDLTEEAIIK